MRDLPPRQLADKAQSWLHRRQANASADLCHDVRISTADWKTTFGLDRSPQANIGQHVGIAPEAQVILVVCEPVRRAWSGQPHGVGERALAVSTADAILAKRGADGGQPGRDAGSVTGFCRRRLAAGAIGVAVGLGVRQAAALPRTGRRQERRVPVHAAMPQHSGRLRSCCLGSTSTGWKGLFGRESSKAWYQLVTPFCCQHPGAPPPPPPPPWSAHGTDGHAPIALIPRSRF